MQAMAWWAIPVVATVIAVVWAMFAARPKGPADAYDSIEQHRAFRAALGGPAEQPAPEAAPSGSDGPADGDAGADRPAA